jgi:hypothetical protein
MCDKDLYVVGSAPLVVDCSTAINGADLVVRFNDCKTLGGYSGNRTDMLFVNNLGISGSRFIREQSLMKLNLADSAEVVFVRSAPVHWRHFRGVSSHFPGRSARQPDHAEGIVEANGLQRLKVRRLTDEFNASVFNMLALCSASPFVSPSTGFLCVESLMHNPAFSDYRIHLVGFGFFGWHGHPWRAEQFILNAYAEDGRLTIHPGAACEPEPSA